MKFFLKSKLILALSLMVILSSCGDNDDNNSPNSPNTPIGGAAKEYMSTRALVIFDQTGVDLLNGKNEEIADSTMVLNRNFISLPNDEIYKYEFTGGTTNKIEEFVIKGKKVSQKIPVDLELQTGNMEFELLIPILDLDLTGNKLYLDTLLKTKVDLTALGIPAQVNLDVNIKSELSNNGAKQFKFNNEEIPVISYTTNTSMSMKLNDPMIDLFPQLKPYQNKVIGTGTFENENYFTKQDNLGIVWQKRHYISQENITSAEGTIKTNEVITRTLKEASVYTKIK